MLGGSVSEGTARFGQISKELRRNFGSELTRVGFTLADMNEVLLDQIPNLSAMLRSL
jgi:hypothetical protein